MGIFKWFSKASKPEQPAQPQLPPLNPNTPLEDFVIYVPRISEVVESTINTITRGRSGMERCAVYEEMVRKGQTVAMCSGIPIVAPCDGKIHFKHNHGYMGSTGPTRDNWPTDEPQDARQRAALEKVTLFKIQPVQGVYPGSYVEAYSHVEKFLRSFNASTRAVIMSYMEAYGGKEGVKERMSSLEKQCWDDFNNVIGAHFRREQLPAPGSRPEPLR
jgi:hypothetical protein